MRDHLPTATKYRMALLKAFVLILLTWVGAITLEAQALSGNGPLTSPASVLQQHGIPIDEEHETAALRNEDPEVRSCAALLLVSSTQDKHVKDIESALKVETNEAVMINLANALSHAGDEQGDQKLVEICQDPNSEPWAAIRAAHQIVGLTPSKCVHAIAVLAQASEQNISTSTTALGALGALRTNDAGRQEVIRALQKGLTSRVDEVRMQSCISFGELGDTRAIPILRDQLNKESDKGIKTQMDATLAKLEGK